MIIFLDNLLSGSYLYLVLPTTSLKDNSRKQTVQLILLVYRECVDAVYFCHGLVS